MEITEKFNLKTKALVIILIGLLLTGVSTMSFAADAGTARRFSLFDGLREKIEAKIEQATEYFQKIKENSEIKLEGTMLKVLISDGDKGNINVNGAIGLAEDGTLKANADGKFNIVIERENGKEPIELVGTTIDGEIVLDMTNKEVTALVDNGELRLVNGTIELGAAGGAMANLEMTDNGIAINGVAEGEVSASVKDNEILKVTGAAEENNARVEAGLTGVTAEVNAKQNVSILKDQLKLKLRENAKANVDFTPGGTAGITVEGGIGDEMEEKVTANAGVEFDYEEKEVYVEAGVNEYETGRIPLISKLKGLIGNLAGRMMAR